MTEKNLGKVWEDTGNMKLEQTAILKKQLKRRHIYIYKCNC